MIDLVVELKATTLAFNQKVIESSDVAETLVKVSENIVFSVIPTMIFKRYY